jgi:DNA helicase-2/ATP-dependent DNA helicase PcrA
MSSSIPSAGSVSELTQEQRAAATSTANRLFIEAGPGTGKTTVSAQRYGSQRFSPEHRHDPRAVVAVSFTRAATGTLRNRVQRLWGTASLEWPHRIVTLDTVMDDLLHDLLNSRLLTWPNQDLLWPDGQVRLRVHDSWSEFSGTVWTKMQYVLDMATDRVLISRRRTAENGYRFPPDVVAELLKGGTCTHDDIRVVLALAMQRPACAARVRQRLGITMRSLIVDEAFDANDLDLTIIEMAARAGVSVTLVGDPWQALYLFRGARPHAIPELVAREGFFSVRLTQSFRWRSGKQLQLAKDLRKGRGVHLPTLDMNDARGRPDVVLALQWQHLWNLGGSVLPLAFRGLKGGGYEEAAATMLLNHITRRRLGKDATYLGPALTALAIADPEILRQLEPDLDEVLSILITDHPKASTEAYTQLSTVIATVSKREMRKPNWHFTKRLDLLRERLTTSGQLVLGLTTHQAKGGEWETVGLALTDSERTALAGGLSSENDTHRKLYVACTRAHQLTVEVASSATVSPAQPPRKRRAKKK